MNLKQLEVFAATVEYNSFTRAGEALYLSQSTVSAHIRALERSLRVSLFSRESKRNMMLTEEGKRVYTAAKDILSRCQALQEGIEHQDERGELSIGASTVPAQHLLPEWMAAFRKKYAMCRYVMKRGDSSDVHAFLRSGEVQIGFVGAKLEEKRCRYHALCQDELVLISEASPRFLELQQRGVLGRELLTEPMVAREEGAGTKRALNDYMRRAGLRPESLHIIARLDQVESIKNSVAQGMGVSVLSKLAVQEEIASGKLVFFPLDENGVFRTIYLIHRREALLTELEQAFIAFVREESGRRHT